MKAILHDYGPTSRNQTCKAEAGTRKGQGHMMRYRWVQVERYSPQGSAWPCIATSHISHPRNDGSNITPNRQRTPFASGRWCVLLGAQRSGYRPNDAKWALRSSATHISHQSNTRTSEQDGEEDQPKQRYPTRFRTRHFLSANSPSLRP